MKSNISFAFALALLVFAQSAHACDKPTSIEILDGAIATEAEMMEAGRGYQQFMLNMRAYQECLKTEANLQRLQQASGSKSAVAARENNFVAMHNAASAAMTRTAERFERAITDFEARQ